MIRYSLFIALFAIASCGGNTPTSPSPDIPVVVAAAPPAIQQPTAPAAVAGPLTWIVSGQSNAVGCAPGRGPAPTDSALMTGSAGWVQASDPLPFFDASPNCEVGPWVTAAQSVAARDGRTVRLTGSGHVGYDMRRWNLGEPSWSALESAIVANGNNADAFLWWQGEADAITGQTPLYQAALANLVQRVRTAAGRPDMRVLVVGLADAPNAETRQEYADLRQAQQAFVAADGHAVYVSAEGLPLLSPPVPAYHLSAAGYAAMGQRIADALR